MKKKLLRLKAFTLIELLVVITIIGILASLAIPTIGAALDKANQTKDVNNIKQTGTILFMDANDNGGSFATNSSTIETFKQLYADGTLSTLAVLAGTGQKVAQSSSTIATNNVAWGYNSGLKTSVHPGTILLLSFGTGYTGNTSTTNVNLTGKTALTALWGEKGIVAYYVGGNAKFSKAKAKQAEILESTNVTDNSGNFKDPGQ